MIQGFIAAAAIAWGLLNLIAIAAILFDAATSQASSAEEIERGDMRSLSWPTLREDGRAD